MSGWKKSREEIILELLEQQAALTASCDWFDAGHTWEAKRIATIIHVLVHDKGRTISLLTQVGLKSATRFLASGPPCNPKNMLSDTPLVGWEMGSDGAKCHPLCGLPNSAALYPAKWLPFTKWWEEAVLKDRSGLMLSRRNLVFSLRDQDGGSHVDEKLTDQAYTSFAKQHGAGWWFQKAGSNPTAIGKDVHRYTMRQIAWEVMQTLQILIPSAGCLQTQEDVPPPQSI